MFNKNILVRFFKKSGGEVNEMKITSTLTEEIHEFVHIRLPDSLTTSEITEKVKDYIEIISTHKSKLPKLDRDITLQPEETHFKLWVMTSERKNPGGISIGMFVDFFIEGIDINIEFSHPTGEVFKATKNEHKDQKSYKDQALRDACNAYLVASDRVHKAMEDGINVHGALSEITGVTNSLHYEIIQVNGPTLA